MVDYRIRSKLPWIIWVQHFQKEGREERREERWRGERDFGSKIKWSSSIEKLTYKLPLAWQSYTQYHLCQGTLRVLDKYLSKYHKNGCASLVKVAHWKGNGRSFSKEKKILIDLQLFTKEKGNIKTNVKKYTERLLPSNRLVFAHRDTQCQWRHIQFALAHFTVLMPFQIL